MIVQQGTPLDCITAMLPSLAVRLSELDPNERAEVEEIRLRRGYTMSVLLPEGERFLGGDPVEESHLRTILEHASQASVHTVLEQVRNGFVTLKGGHRIGLCGTAVCSEGRIQTLRYLSSVSIRVARAVEGQAREILPFVTKDGAFISTLIIGPPGSGKTTLLREMIRMLSEGIGIPARRVALADERGEVAALWRGEPQFAVGCRTDVLDGCKKGEAMCLLLRGMNPEVLAVDEITHPEDVTAMLEAVGCGVSLLATAHGGGLKDLERRPVYRRILTERVFQRGVIVERNGRVRSVRVEKLP